METPTASPAILAARSALALAEKEHAATSAALRAVLSGFVAAGRFSFSNLTPEERDALRAARAADLSADLAVCRAWDAVRRAV